MSSDRDVPEERICQCAFCGEAVDEDSGDVSPTMVGTPDGMRMAHRSCSLREVVGGIGHLIAHDYWCIQRRDPDATLTYRQSALLVDVYCAVVGIQPVGGDRR